MPESQPHNVRVEIELSDGTLRRLTGPRAKQWGDAVSGVCFIAGIHGNPFPNLEWEEFRKVGGPSEKYAPLPERDIVEEQRVVIEKLYEALKDADRQISDLHYAIQRENALGLVKHVKSMPLKDLMDKATGAIVAKDGMIPFGHYGAWA